jgi:hypothetical protein
MHAVLHESEVKSHSSTLLELLEHSFAVCGFTSELKEAKH